MRFISLWKILFAVVVFTMGSHAGEIPSCQQQLITAFAASVDPSVLTPTCLKEALPSLNELNTTALHNGRRSCSDVINTLQDIANILKSILSTNTSVCGVSFTPLTLANAELKLNILGVPGLPVSVRDVSVSITGTPSITAVASLNDLSPLVLGINVDSPLLMKAKVGAGGPVGQLAARIPVHADVTIKSRLKYTLRVAVDAGEVSVTLAGASICSIEDLDYPAGSGVGVDSGITLAVVSIVSIGLVNAVAILFGGFASIILKMAVDTASGIQSD